MPAYPGKHFDQLVRRKQLDSTLVNFADVRLGHVEAFCRLALRHPFRFDTGFCRFHVPELYYIYLIFLTFHGILSAMFSSMKCDS